MSEILFQYEKINPATWVYLSSLLMIGLFFQFNRFWSVRNLDLLLLILLAPGLLMVNHARERAERGMIGGANVTTAAPPGQVATDSGGPPERITTSDTAAAAASAITAGRTEVAPLSRHRVAYIGYLWLLGVSLVWLIRMLVDPTMVRRPLLEPNATKGCLLFLGCSLFVFLMANVIVSDPTPDDLKHVESAKSLLKAQDNGRDRDKPEDYARFGPGYAVLLSLPTISTHPFIRCDHPQSTREQEIVAKSMAIGAH